MAAVPAVVVADDELAYPVYIGPWGVPSVSKYYDRKTAYPGTKIIGHTADGRAIIENCFIIGQSYDYFPVVSIVIGLGARLAAPNISQLLTFRYPLGTAVWNTTSDTIFELQLTAEQIANGLVTDYKSTRTQLELEGIAGGEALSTFEELRVRCDALQVQFPALSQSVNDFFASAVTRLTFVEDQRFARGWNKFSDDYPGDTPNEKITACVTDKIRNTLFTSLRNKFLNLQGAPNLKLMTRKFFHILASANLPPGDNRFTRAHWLAVCRGYELRMYPEAVADQNQANINAQKIQALPTNLQDQDFFNLVDHNGNPWVLITDGGAQAIAIDVVVNAQDDDEEEEFIGEDEEEEE
jgi:hypothetical protein